MPVWKSRHYCWAGFTIHEFCSAAVLTSEKVSHTGLTLCTALRSSQSWARDQSPLPTQRLFLHFLVARCHGLTISMQLNMFSLWSRMAAFKSPFGYGPKCQGWLQQLNHKGNHGAASTSRSWYYCFCQNGHGLQDWLAAPLMHSNCTMKLSNIQISRLKKTKKTDKVTGMPDFTRSGIPERKREGWDLAKYYLQ